MPRTLRSLALAPLVALALAGCAGGGFGNSFKEPEIRMQRIVVRGLGITGGNLDLVLDVNNPNGFNLRGTRLELGFDVEGTHVGDVEYRDEFQVPQNGSTQLTLPLRFGWGGVGAAFRSALQYGDLPYTIKGRAIMNVGGREIGVPFTREGRAPLTRTTSPS